MPQYITWTSHKLKLLIRCQDTSDPGHFWPKTLRHHQTGTLQHWHRTVSTSSKHFCYSKP